LVESFRFVFAFLWIFVVRIGWGFGRGSCFGSLRILLVNSAFIISTTPVPVPYHYKNNPPLAVPARHYQMSGQYSSKTSSF